MSGKCHQNVRKISRKYLKCLEIVQFFDTNMMFKILMFPEFVQNMFSISIQDVFRTKPECRKWSKFGTCPGHILDNENVQNLCNFFWTISGHFPDTFFLWSYIFI